MKYLINGVLLVSILLPLQVASGYERNEAVQIPPVTDLRVDGRLSLESRRPIVVMFSADHCSYCMVVEEEFIKPMIISGDYVDRVLFRQIDLDRSQTVINLKGEPSSGSDLAQHYAVSVTPTVLFLDHEGRELSKRLVGITTAHYYGYYLDEAINNAVRHLRQPAPPAERAISHL